MADSFSSLTTPGQIARMLRRDVSNNALNEIYAIRSSSGHTKIAIAGGNHTMFLEPRELAAGLALVDDNIRRAAILKMSQLAATIMQTHLDGQIADEVADRVRQLSNARVDVVIMAHRDHLRNEVMWPDLNHPPRIAARHNNGTMSIEMTLRGQVVRLSTQQMVGVLENMDSQSLEAAFRACTDEVLTAISPHCQNPVMREQMDYTLRSRPANNEGHQDRRQKPNDEVSMTKPSNICSATDVGMRELGELSPGGLSGNGKGRDLV